MITRGCSEEEEKGQFQQQQEMQQQQSQDSQVSPLIAFFVSWLELLGFISCQFQFNLSQQQLPPPPLQLLLTPQKKTQLLNIKHKPYSPILNPKP